MHGLFLYFVACCDFFGYALLLFGNIFGIFGLGLCVCVSVSVFFGLGEF